MKFALPIRNLVSGDGWMTCDAIGACLWFALSFQALFYLGA